MPALKQEYDYIPRQVIKKQGVAKKSARPVSAPNYAGSKVKKNAQTATQRVASVKKSVTKQKHSDIDVPIVVKKKIELQKPEEMKLKKPKDNIKAKQKTQRAKRSIVATVLAFGLLYMICMRYAKINELTHELNSLEKDLAASQSLNGQLNAEIDSKTDLSFIEKYAKIQLGMQKPDDKQVVRIAYDKQDKISTPIVISEDSEDSFWEKLWKDLRNLVD